MDGEFLLIMLVMLYFFYYIVYKYIIEIGTSYIYWHLWHTALCAGLAICLPLNAKMEAIILGCCIISCLLLYMVIAVHSDIHEMIKQRIAEYIHKFK